MKELRELQFDCLERCNGDVNEYKAYLEVMVRQHEANRNFFTLKLFKHDLEVFTKYVTSIKNG